MLKTNVFVLFVTWCMLVALCSTEQTQSSHSVIGRRCCWDNDSSGNCSALTEFTVFSPLVLVNKTRVPSDQLVSWTPSSILCPPNYKVKYIHLNETSRDMLYIRDGEMKLAWRDVYYRITSEYCVEQRIGSRQYYAALCRPVIKEMCAREVCVTKCCGHNEELVPQQQLCNLTSHDHFNLTFHTVGGNPALPRSRPVIVDQTPSCKSSFMLAPHEDSRDNYYLLPNGQLYFESLDSRHNPGRYCIDYDAEDGVMVAVLCNEPHQSAALNVKDRLTTAGVFISAVFLAITIILHLATPELRDMQGRCLLSHMAALLTADVALFTAHFSHNINVVHCIVNGMVLQFAFLAAFFWLNVMCFDIWRVIRATVNLIPLSGILEKDQKKFRVYSVYAWGGPAVVTIITVIMIHTPPQEDDSKVITPDIGEISCFFFGDLERLAYFYGLTAFLFAINIVFLVHTIILLYTAGGAFQCCVVNQGNITSFNRTHLRSFWQRFSLFIVMAFCWVSEILSWKIPPPELWIFTDILNSLQGFMVFIIFISSRKKRDTVKAVWDGAMVRLSETTRKLSSTDASGVTWHVPTSSVSLKSRKDSQHTPSSVDESAPVD